MRLALAILFFTAAPTAGDIGGACSAQNDLDPVKFFEVKQSTDCARCLSCALTTQACEKVCTTPPALSAFPYGCEPLEHDGEVCLDALQSASCGAYAGYMADVGGTVPTECDFCSAASAPVSPAASASAQSPSGDGGTAGGGGAP